MFSAMCDNPSFFKDRMKLYVALAPVVSVKNMGSKFVRDICQNEKLIKSIRMLGYEHFTKATADNFLSGLIVGSALGNATSE